MKRPMASSLTLLRAAKDGAEEGTQCTEGALVPTFVPHPLLREHPLRTEEGRGGGHQALNFQIRHDTGASRVPARAIRASAASIVCVLALALAGCATARPARPTAPERLPTVTELSAVLEQRREDLHGLRTLARMRYRDGEESGSARQVIVLSRPDRLRIEVLSILGTVFVMTTDPQSFRAYARDEDTVYRGQPSPVLMGRYMRVALAVNDVIDLLLASPPSLAMESAEVSFDDEAGAIRLAEADGDGARRLWFSAAYEPISAEQRDPDGNTEWRAEFGGYETRQGLRVATRVNLEIPPSQRHIELTLVDPEVNPALDDSVFSLQAPSSAKVVDLDQGVE